MTEAVIIAIISSSALASIISLIGTIITNRMQKHDGISKGVRQLLYMDIKAKCDHYIERGYILSEELEDLTIEHGIYHTDLHGNGFLDARMKVVNGLPNHPVQQILL